MMGENIYSSPLGGNSYSSPTVETVKSYALWPDEILIKVTLLHWVEYWLYSFTRWKTDCASSPG